MSKKISLVTCGLLLSTSMAFGADSIDEAFKTGTVSGSLTAYGIYTDNKTNTDDTNVGYGTINLGYETAAYKGFSAKAAFEAGHAFDDGSLDNDALMTEAYIKYAIDGFDLTVGRQAIDLEWLGDYNEAVVAGITAIPDTTITLGYVNQQTAADEDEIGEFEELTEDGLYVLDAKYTGFDGVELNPYVYSAPDVADFYGLKATYTADMFGLVGQYAVSNEDTGPDGSIGNVELNTTIAGLSAAVGYIKTDDTAGVGTIATYGDNISPFDYGQSTYDTDAKTIYGSLGYSIAGIDLGVLYGETKYDTVDYKEKELNLTADYSITDSLTTSVLYVDLNVDEVGEAAKGSNGTVDQNYVSLTVAYSF